MGTADEPLEPGDLVRAKGRTDWPVWKVHAVHDPVTPDSPPLVSVRPAGKPLNKSFKGWPAGFCHTIRRLKVEKIGREVAVKRDKVQKIPGAIPLEIHVNARLTTDDVIEALVSSNDIGREEVLQFMKDLDDRVCDIDFTKALAKHFAEVVKHERSSTKLEQAAVKKAKK